MNFMGQVSNVVAKFNKDEIKNSLTIEQIFELVAELGGEPVMINSGSFSAKTICHNLPGEGSQKLYYYDNTKLFQCYTDCAGSFDIFELVMKVKNTRAEFKTNYSREGIVPREWVLPDAIFYVVCYFGIEGAEEDFDELEKRLPDWDYFKTLEKREERAVEKNKGQIIELKVYDDNILNNLPHPRILPWEEEGISDEVIKARGIAYDPRNQAIIIPHYNVDDELVGIRQRTLITEDEKFGKYRPAILNGTMYTHPLGFNLYNLNNSKLNISLLKKVIVFEGEKSPMLYASYFGLENDITVACCGSNLLKNQVDLLLNLGVEEIIIAFDKQFKEIADDEWKRLVKNLHGLHEKYGMYVQFSYMFDRENLLGYKESPIDRGPEIFMQMFKERVVID